MIGRQSPRNQSAWGCRSRKQGWALPLAILAGGIYSLVLVLYNFESPGDDVGMLPPAVVLRASIPEASVYADAVDLFISAVCHPREATSRRASLWKGVKRVVSDVVDGLDPSRPATVTVHMLLDDINIKHLTPGGQLSCDNDVCIVPYSFEKVLRDYSNGITTLCTEFGKTGWDEHGFYNAACVFLVKAALYKILPASIDKVIALDADMRVAGDIRDIWKSFPVDVDPPGRIGLVLEQQPTYLAAVGIQGFNGGVQLHNLRQLRADVEFQAAFQGFRMDKFAAPYHQGMLAPLGDQTLFTMLSEVLPSKFVVLGCEWNVQLCRWAFDAANLRAEGFELSPLKMEKFRAEAECRHTVRILHGNCASQRPNSDELEGETVAWQARVHAARTLSQ